MEAVIHQESRAAQATQSRIIDAAQFRKLLVSHRRMVRVDQRGERLRGLQDLDTGEVFFTDEQRLVTTNR